MATAAMSPPSEMDVDVEHKPTLTPPASEEADKQYDSGSELSELELEPEDRPEDGGEIEPDHYYDCGKIPVFKPVSFAHRPCFDHSYQPKRCTVSCLGCRWKLIWCFFDRPWTNSEASSPSSIRSTNMV